jgi:CheY-like chemotaxis protein/anti-sigma regulatory factor (Ser/Thr protein kinase)
MMALPFNAVGSLGIPRNQFVRICHLFTLARNSVTRVLVVEDDAATHYMVCKALESAGISTASAMDGIEALSLIRREPFDLILLDLGLPGLHGLEVLKKVQELGSHTRVIVMTGDDAPETVLKAVQGQACRYVLKPVAMKALLELVQEELAAKSSPGIIEVLSARPEWIELLVPCDLESADRIQSFMRHLDANLPEHVRDSIGRAFRELLLNAVEWGGKLDPNHKVRISYLRARRMLMYRISDPGPGFSLDCLPHAAICNPQQDPLGHLEVRREKGLRPGGFGLLLVQSLVDELIYNEARNEVVLIKYLD